MWPADYWAPRYWNPRYWAKVGANPPVTTGVNIDQQPFTLGAKQSLAVTNNPLLGGRGNWAPCT